MNQLPKTAGEAAMQEYRNHKGNNAESWQAGAQAAIDFHLSNLPDEGQFVWVLCDMEQAEKYISSSGRLETPDSISQFTAVAFVRRARKAEDVEKLKAEVEFLNNSLREQGEYHNTLEGEISRLKLELEKHRWIPVSERMPTKEDADSRNEVIWNLVNAGALAHSWQFKDKNATHWKPTHLPQIDTEQQRFEKWAKDTDWNITKAENGEYKSIATLVAWAAWQARGKEAAQ